MGMTWLVTGADRGLGKEFVQQITFRGDRVLVTCRSDADVAQLKREFRFVYQLDVTSQSSLEVLQSSLHHTPIDILINNAGIGVGGSSFVAEDWDSMIDFFKTNAIGPMRVAKTFLEQLRTGRRKLIVNISTEMASLENVTSGGAYGYRASKAALNMLTRIMSFDLEPDGFTCVTIHPGWVETRMGGSAAPLTPQASVACILTTLDALTTRDTGKFIDLSGNVIAW